MSINHTTTIASTNRSRGSIHFTVCLLAHHKLAARALPKGRLLYLPRDTVKGIEELAVTGEDLHYRE
jgi:hypothetical protein